MSARLERLAAMQRPDGSFECLVAMPNGSAVDSNGFSTACVLRALRAVPDAQLAVVRSRAIDFLSLCQSSTVPGAYGFWPEKLRPSWATRVPPDVDDTALIVTELHRHGRIRNEAALRALCTVILPFRVLPCDCHGLPPWIVPGCFQTWIAPRGTKAAHVQVIDACVGANVVALMARIGAAHLPGYREACAAVDRGIAWAAEDPTRLASITPFYPSPRSFVETLRHAVECGASNLAPALHRVASIAPPARTDDAGCCSSAYGRVVWRCPALEEARAIAAEPAC